MKRQTGTLILAAAGMLALILDSRTALAGAAQGLELCLKTVIPALFPFIFLSGLLTGTLAGRSFSALRPLGRFCGMPPGSEGLLVIGLLGGYPTGAACVSEYHRSGLLTKEQAQRLLGFCNNAGPAFLFGIGGSLFSNLRVPWVLWLIHILGALLSAHILPEGDLRPVKLSAGQVSVTTVLQRSVRIMGSVCGWVVLFRILLAFASRWFLWLFPSTFQILFGGLLELANGCCSLSGVHSDALRFLLLSALLAFGGLCVMMQTRSAAQRLSLTWFYVGKLLQTLFSLLLSMTVLPFLFPGTSLGFLYGALPMLCILCLFGRFSKKTVAFPEKVVYNGGK